MNGFLACDSRYCVGGADQVVCVSRAFSMRIFWLLRERCGTGMEGGKAGWRTRRTGNRNFQKGVWHPQNTGGHHRQPRGTFVGPPILAGGWVGSFLARFGPSKYRVLVPGVACRVQRMYIIYARERPQRAKRGVCILSSGCMCPCLHTCACVVQPRHVRVRVVQPHAPPHLETKCLNPGVTGPTSGLMFISPH